MSRSFIYRHHVEPRVKLYSPREGSFPIPLKYIGVSRNTRTNLDVKQDKRIDDYWNIDGSRDLSAYWTGFTQFILLEEKPPDGYMWSGERWTRKQLTSRPDHLWPELWDKMSSRRRSNSGHMKSSILITHENCEGSISLTRRTRNSRKPSRMLVRNRKHQLLLLCFAKLWRRIVGVMHPTKSRQDLACILEASESTSVRENCCWLIMKTILQERETVHYSIIIWYTNLFLCLKLWRFQQQRQQWTRNGKNWNNFGVEPDESQKQERGDRWSKNEGCESSCRLTEGRMSFEKYRIGGKTPKIQRSSCTPRWYCKRRFWVLCSFHWTRIISITNDSSKRHGYHLQFAWLRWTSGWRSICLYPGQNGGCSQTIENSKIGMSRHLDSSTSTQMA